MSEFRDPAHQLQTDPGDPSDRSCPNGEPTDTTRDARGRFLPDNTAARKRPINTTRLAHLRQTFIDHYQPHDPLLIELCAQLANIIERSDSTKAGSAEHQRLIQLAQSLGATLETARPASDPEATRLPGIPELPCSALDLAIDLLSRIAQGEAISDYQRGQLTVLDQAMRGTLLLNGELVDADPPTVTIATPDPITEAPPVDPPDPRCSFCGQEASSCVEIRDEVRFLSEHRDREDVRAHLAAQAALRRKLGWDFGTIRDGVPLDHSTEPDDPTAVMLRMMGRRSPWE